MNCTVGFVNGFLRVPLAYQPCCPGKQGELSENCLPNLTVQFILGRSTRWYREIVFDLILTGLGSLAIFIHRYVSKSSNRSSKDHF